MSRKKVEVTRGDINIVNRAIRRGLDDGSPQAGEQEARKQYCAIVSGAFDSFLRARIEYMIRQQERELCNPMGAREQDLFHKGTVNALSLLLNWGDEMAQEYSSYGPKKEVNQLTSDAVQGSDGVIISSM